MGHLCRYRATTRNQSGNSKPPRVSVRPGPILYGHNRVVLTSHAAGYGSCSGVIFFFLGHGRHDREAQTSYHRPTWIPLWVEPSPRPILIPTLKRPLSEGITPSRPGRVQSRLPEAQVVPEPRVAGYRGRSPAGGDLVACPDLEYAPLTCGCLNLGSGRDLDVVPAALQLSHASSRGTTQRHSGAQIKIPVFVFTGSKFA